MWIGTMRSSWCEICSIVSGAPVVTMVMRDRACGMRDFGDRQAFDIIAAPGEQADDAGENARLVIDQDGKRMCLDVGPCRRRRNRAKARCGGLGVHELGPATLKSGSREPALDC